MAIDVKSSYGALQQALKQLESERGPNARIKPSEVKDKGLKALVNDVIKQDSNTSKMIFSLADLTGLDDQQLEAHAVEIRSRLREVYETLKIQFPVYLLITKCDLAEKDSVDQALRALAEPDQEQS